MRINLMAGVLILTLPVVAHAASDETTTEQASKNQTVETVPPAPRGPYFSRRLMPQMGPNTGSNVAGYPPVGFDPMASSSRHNNNMGSTGNGAGAGATEMDARMNGRFNMGNNMGGNNRWGGNNSFVNNSPYGQPYGTPFNGYQQNPNAPQGGASNNAPLAATGQQDSGNAPQAAPNTQPPAEPEWAAKRRAEAEKYRAEAQKRYEKARAESQKRYAEAEKYRAEMQKRYAEDARKRAAAYAAQRQSYGQQGYGVPYGAPYGYARQPQR